MVEKPYTDTDVDLVADAIVDARLQGHRDWTDRIARAVLDALIAAGRMPAAHHRPLLRLTADEVEALHAAATAWWGDPGPERPAALTSALRKLTVTEETA